MSAQREARREQQRVEEFLTALVIDFMHYIKRQNPFERHATAKADAKFQELNARWKHKCHDKDCAWMQLNINAFSENVQRLATAGEKDNIVGVNPKTKEIIQPNKSKIISIHEANAIKQQGKV